MPHYTLTLSGRDTLFLSTVLILIGMVIGMLWGAPW